ncbi:MAG: hypothetical protein HYV09_29510 [Deltaproteobacteria bacterium]|nr:hypothetical protein [Deltaproteobacteria bacterium]
MKELEDGEEIGGGLTGIGRFFDDPCGCGSKEPYGKCCGLLEGAYFFDFCTKIKLDREFALVFGQVAWRIARDTPAARWYERAREVAEEACREDPHNTEEMYSMLIAILEAHRAMFPWIDGGGPGCS